MALAIILGICFLVSTATPAVPKAFASQAPGQQPQPTTSQSPENTASQPQTSEPKAPAPDQPAPSTVQEPAPPQPPPAAKPHHKKSADTNCPVSTPATQPPAGDTSNTTTTAPPCPPKKRVIRNGGTDEPRLHLSGGTKVKQSSEPSTTQLLAVTEKNLKKVVDRQLNTGQQEMLRQIRAFMEQSKQATAAGDLAQAQNLASKARLLSDELVKP
jgi:hypothetical protein